jgi:hypothetical protein
MAREIGPGWHGEMTVANYREIGLCFYNLLKGKTYTWVSIQATQPPIPNYLGRMTVRPGEHLRLRHGWTTGGYDGPHCPLTFFDDGDYPGFGLATSYGPFLLYTRLNRKPHAERRFRDVPYIHFHREADTVVIEIEECAPDGTFTKSAISIDATHTPEDWA